MYWWASQISLVTDHTIIFYSVYLFAWRYELIKFYYGQFGFFYFQSELFSYFVWASVILACKIGQFMSNCMIRHNIKDTSITDFQYFHIMNSFPVFEKDIFFLTLIAIYISLTHPLCYSLLWVWLRENVMCESIIPDMFALVWGNFYFTFFACSVVDNFLMFFLFIIHLNLVLPEKSF